VCVVCVCVVCECVCGVCVWCVCVCVCADGTEGFKDFFGKDSLIFNNFIYSMFH